jgi:hypothetical protein
MRKSDNIYMHRWLAMAALGAALLTTPVWGQRGGRGGMSMGGVGRGGYASHGGGGFSRGPVYGGGPHGGANWGAGSRGWSGGHSPNGGWGWRRPPYGHYPYRYWGRGYPWGYGYGGSWYPGWGWYGGAGWYGDSYSYPAQNYPAYVYASPDNSDAYAQNNQLQQDEIDRLNDEVARLRDERESRPPQNPAPAPPPKAQVHAETLLVFRDRHTEEIQNYAIVGKTLWLFTEQRARKIPIAELDVPATAKANDDRGVDFRLPK